jgi:galactose mutarotase-like enzyme
MGIQLEHIHFDSFQAVVLANDALRVVIVPELGGKIVSLQTRVSGREWLWNNPHLPLRVPPAGSTNFGLFDSGGWDEIFPTVNPCRVPDSAWGNRTLTDHGELWYWPWHVSAAKVVRNELALLTLAVDESELPFRFERTLAIPNGDGPLTAHYELTNLSEAPMPYIWAAHPLLAIEPGDSIRISNGSRTTVTNSVGIEFASDTKAFAWPNAPLASGEILDLSRMPSRDACFAVKVFVEIASPREIAIVDRKRGEFIRFSLGKIPYIGLWLNYCAWSGAGTEPYYNAGIEPTTAPRDDLNAAIQNRSVMQLLKNERHSWGFAVAGGTLVNHDISA